MIGPFLGATGVQAHVDWQAESAHYSQCSCRHSAASSSMLCLAPVPVLLKGWTRVNLCQETIRTFEDGGLV